MATCERCLGGVQKEANPFFSLGKNVFLFKTGRTLLGHQMISKSSDPLEETKSKGNSFLLGIRTPNSPKASA